MDNKKPQLNRLWEGVTAQHIHCTVDCSRFDPSHLQVRSEILEGCCQAGSADNTELMDQESIYERSFYFPKSTRMDRKETND